MQTQAATEAAPKPLTSRQLAKIATRQKVLVGAAVLFDAGGYEVATMRSIAKHIGMSTGALSSNFSSKSELYRAVYGHNPLSPEVGRVLLAAAVGVLRCSALPEHWTPGLRAAISLAKQEA